ncbi:hypothetical protein CLAFUW4_11218 [Fulvia fulva]|uniref:Heterokaryon incompatibility domain-containing protein n=1 Tax=Passalora fulva TaxID=5499 RepID=A0A9Q8PC52_PASFU|nr:uncharacterized protein CLAFUR5_10262 [Fulvia fulva]KAK4619455.1 hypothetical protein CLAFUR4_11223 [Fulvia fulva]KAK4621051.1 hypothetical protein CLAFUR0_11228 [Fulvia fulva]UJO19762.1 hypothetical protein CLAFUR5_10262 [Fulvia fulva]WPV17279.1 hypothetical protein CLAFUW4_11218 [Fulvia fulva]WPV32509.1 hypothetical protein CLAFUW7_11214 [Fulvia fulva]
MSADPSTSAVPLGLKYCHEPLEDSETSIRPLQLKDDQEGTQLQLSLRSWRLSDVPHYATLSYTWADKEDTRDVLVNNAVFVITKNCWLALTRLRKLAKESNYFWIDAICINQLDERERSAQVNIMGRIYRGSSVTYVLLSEHGLAGRYLFEDMPFLTAAGYNASQS